MDYKLYRTADGQAGIFFSLFVCLPPGNRRKIRLVAALRWGRE